MSSADFAEQRELARATPVGEQTPHVLVIDDDARLLRLLVQFLRRHDLVAVTAHDSITAKKCLRTLAFDLIILDVMLPGESGLVLLGDIRRENGPPVLLLSALDQAEHRIRGLEVGADDYLTKPFEPRELLLRIQAILRRARPESGRIARLDADSASGHDIFRLGGWLVDLETGRLRAEGRDITLAPLERRLLRCLASSPARIWSRDELGRACRITGNERSIDVQIARLRRKIEHNPHRPQLLLTERGAGYRLRRGITNQLSDE